MLLRPRVPVLTDGLNSSPRLPKRLISTPPRCNVLTGSVASGCAGTSIAGASWHSTSLSIGRSTARVGSRACWPSRPTRFRLLQRLGCQTLLQRLGRQTRSAPRTQCGTQYRLAALPTWLLKPFVGGVRQAPNKRLKLTGGDRSKGSGVLCAAAHQLSFNDTAPAGGSPA